MIFVYTTVAKYNYVVYLRFVSVINDRAKTIDKGHQDRYIYIRI